MPEVFTFFQQGVASLVLFVKVFVYFFTFLSAAWYKNALYRR